MCKTDTLSGEVTDVCDDVYITEGSLTYAVAGRRLAKMLADKDVDRYAKVVVVADGEYLGTIDLDNLQAIGLADLLDQVIGLCDLSPQPEDAEMPSDRS